jgi:hypothetical protein
MFKDDCVPGSCREALRSVDSDVSGADSQTVRGAKNQ